MKRSNSVFALLLCLAAIYYAAAGWEERVVFPAGSGGRVYEEEERSEKEVKRIGAGKKYSAEFLQEQRAYTVTAVDTRETCREEDGEYGIFRVCVRNGAGDAVQEFACKVPVRHVVSLGFDDLNFDGFPDLKIGYSNWKNDTNYCSVYLWDTKEGKFSGEKICIPMEYEKAEEQKMFRAVIRGGDVEERVIYRIDGEGKLDKLRWWEIDEGAHSQTIMDGRSGEILYEGSWGRSGKEDFEDEKDYEDIFWSGLVDEAELRIWWECKAGGGQVVLQDLIPDQSLKLVFCKDGREKIVRIFRKRRDYGNPKEYKAGVFEASSGQEGIWLWNHLYPKWRNMEYYVVAGSQSGNEALQRLDKDWTNVRKEAAGRRTEEKRRKATEQEIQREMERKIEFAQKLLQSEEGFEINREEYLAVFTNMPRRDGKDEYDQERKIMVHRAAFGDLDGDGAEDRAVIEMRKKGGYGLHIYMGKAEETDGMEGLGKNLPEDFTESLSMMDDECLYHSEISILGNQIVITGEGGEVFRGFQTVVFEWKEGGGIRCKLLLNGEREQGSSEARWEAWGYRTGGAVERKIFAGEDAGEDMVKLYSLEEYQEKEALEGEENEAAADEMKVYEEFLRGERGLYVRMGSLCRGASYFSVWDRYTLEDILNLLDLYYWMDGGGEEQGIAKIEYAYLDCGGDGFRELAVRLSGTETCGMADDSGLTLLISCKSGRLELCNTFETGCGSWAELYYYGLVDSGAGNYGFGNLFLDADCKKNVIFEADENWNIEILRERIRQLGIREEWMERKELQWEEMEAGK